MIGVADIQAQPKQKSWVDKFYKNKKSQPWVYVDSFQTTTEKRQTLSLLCSYGLS